MKDLLIIVRRNFISPIVIAILVLSLILLLLREYRDSLFISVVIVINTLLAIVQEVRAQRALKKLELMSAPKARRVLSNGTIEEVMFDQLVVGDIIQLQGGDEVPADGVVEAVSGLESDESILTGESAPVEKEIGAVVYAASVIVAGGATVRVTAVGLETKAGSMTATLKRYVPQLTPLQTAVARAITWLTYGALGLAITIFVVYSLYGLDAVVIFKTITSAAVVIVPEGLLLASSLLLAFGSIKLALAKVLPQKLAAIEAMALLNVLCVDKTGTLTSDEISFESVELFNERDKNISELVAIVAAETGNGNSTSTAIVNGIGKPDKYEILEVIAFSSARKMSGVKVKFGGRVYSVFAGAPEFLAKLAPLSSTQKIRLEGLASEGKRVMLVAVFDDINTPIKKLSNGSGRAVGLIVLANELREGVKKTVKYLQKNGVSIRVISGDNPDTVRYVTKSAGITAHHKILTGAALAEISDEDWDARVLETTIFARVLPEQKERLIDTFHSHGNFTGMVGDGVNDALALKKADLGIAMYAGAIATRRVADIVLMNNSFNSLPLGMRLGNRIIQAIELVAALFFHKIIYGVVLLTFTLIMGVVYPFEPRHITFMNIFLVTAPTVMWTLFTPQPLHRLSPKTFWRDTLQAVAPIAALSGLVVTASYMILRYLHPADPQGVSTMTVLIATFFGIYLVFLVPRMFDIKHTRKSRLAWFLYLLLIVLAVLPSFGIDWIREFFNFSTPAYQNIWMILVGVLLVAVLQWRIAISAGRRFKQTKE
ncbi:MAG: HAD-IC family P-type ATPase [Candidatus Saccharibacteria bacterium]